MQYSYRLAEPEDLNNLMRIYVEAQKFMEKNGNPQWPKGFPDKNDVLGGILGGILYVVECEGQAAAVFSVVTYDGDYDNIDGKWLSGGNYIAVHRVATAEKFRGKGAAKYIIKCVEDIARSRGRDSIRMDTHKLNVPMQRLLLSHGFTECGQISLIRDGSLRIAFEKLI